MIGCMITLTGCAGRTPRPISVIDPGDEARSCKDIAQELEMIDIDRMQIHTDFLDQQNAVVLVVGVFFPPAWLLLDLKTAEREELAAYNSRYSRLKRLAVMKNCTV